MAALVLLGGIYLAFRDASCIWFAGDLIHQTIDSASPQDRLRCALILMAMCITVEGAILHYGKTCRYPYVLSLLINGIGYLAAILFSFGYEMVVIEDVVTGPTAFSMVFEALLVVGAMSALPRLRLGVESERAFWRVIAANTVTNGVILTYLRFR